VFIACSLITTTIYDLTFLLTMVYVPGYAFICLLNRIECHIINKSNSISRVLKRFLFSYLFKPVDNVDL